MDCDLYRNLLIVLPKSILCFPSNTLKTSYCISELDEIQIVECGLSRKQARFCEKISFWL